MIKMTTVIKTPGLTKAVKVLGSKTMIPLLDRVVSQWGLRYRSFAQRRYAKFSKGGGDWKPLSKLRERNKAADPDNQQQGILRDTGTLFRVLDPIVLSPGAIEKKTDFVSVLLGFGGSASHPKAPMTIADLATKHNDGKGVPKRTIIVEPPDDIKQQMAEDLARAIAKIGNDDE
jgi:hypothetical protein